MRSMLIFIGVLIIIGSIVCGIVASVISWRIVVPERYRWEPEYKRGKMIYGVMVASIFLGVLVNVGFGFFLVAVGEILLHLQHMDSGWDREEQLKKEAQLWEEHDRRQT